MREYQVQVPIGHLPVHLILVGNREKGRVVFVPVRQVGFILENVEAGKVGAMFWNEAFSLSDADTTEGFEYERLYDYKNIPLMLRWLQQQNLQEPNVMFG